jgi:hypothetical protein
MNCFETRVNQRDRDELPLGAYKAAPALPNKFVVLCWPSDRSKLSELFLVVSPLSQVSRVVRALLPATSIFRRQEKAL